MSSPPSPPDREKEKRLAAEMAAELVEDGMAVGLGTGTTVAYLLPALARRRLAVVCVATSPATEASATELGLDVHGGRELDRLDIAIDGADQVSADRWLVKGGGGAHTREKIVAASAERFVVIVSDDKLVESIVPPVPVELLRYGLSGTLRRLGNCLVRDAPLSPDGGVIADWVAAFAGPAELAHLLEQEPGVVSHGLFPPSMVSDVIVGRSGGAEFLPLG